MIGLVKSTFYKERDTKRKLVDFILKSDFLSMGKETKKFEKNFAKAQKRKYAVFVNSGSSANLVLLQSLVNLSRLKRGDKIGISALTWATNIMPAIQLGLKPIVIDCEIETLNVSSKTLKKAINKLDALFLTNVLGFCHDIDNIKRLCQEKSVLLIEDNCESLGSRVNKTLLGNFGLASTFSFFVGHHLSTIEGGMICADDEELGDMLVMVRAHGWDRNLPRHKKEALRTLHNVSEFLAKYCFYDLGYNFRPTDINGFLGNNQLAYLNKMIAQREKNFKKWQSAINQNQELYPIKTTHMSTVSNFAMPIIVRKPELFKKYQKKFIDNDVEIRPVIAGNITEHPFYKKHVGINRRRYKNADYIHKYGFYFGNNAELTNAEVNLIRSLLQK